MTKHWLWIEQNMRTLERYIGEYVAVAEEEGRLLAHSPRADEVIKVGRESGLDFWVFFVPISWGGRVRIYPIRTRSVRRASWEPLYTVVLMPGTDRALRLDMLLDSGADVSCISQETGQALGFIATTGERRERAEGVGGFVEYLERELEMEIDGHRFTAPVAWFQAAERTGAILGRETVFDCFDVVIRQRDREIELRWRGPPQG